MILSFSQEKSMFQMLGFYCRLDYCERGLMYVGPMRICCKKLQ